MEQEPNDQEGSETKPELTPQSRPRIYVASLSDYNAGLLHGAWLNADASTDELESGVRSMLASSPNEDAEEFSIFDHDGFGPLHLSEYESLSNVSTIGTGIAKHGMAFAHWAEMVGTTNPDALNDFDGNYRGHWESVHSFAAAFLDDLGANHDIEKSLPEYLQRYIKLDVEGFARDLEYGGEITTSDGDGGVYIFDGGPWI